MPPLPPTAASAATDEIDEELNMELEDTVMNEEYDSDTEDIIRTREELNDERLQEEEEETDGFGTRGLSVKPFMGVVQVAPTNPKPIDRSLPSQGLSLDFVHGYRCHDSRNNLVLNTEGKAVYHAAALVITMDLETREQTFFTGHDDDILCLAQNPQDPDIVATGQIATVENGRSKPPHVCIHNTVTREQWVIKNAGQRAIRALAFSADGRYLATAECDDKYTISVWDWRVSGGKKLASAPSAAKTNIIQIAWNPVTSEEFVSVGNNHIAFWTFDAQNGKLKAKNGLNSVPNQVYSTAVYTVTGNQTLIGGKDGGIYVFARGAARKVFRAHSKKIHSIAQQGKHFVSGGDDKKLCILNNKLEPVWQVEFQYQVRSIYSDLEGNLLVGTRGSEIFYIPYEKQQPLGHCVSYKQLDPPVICGHFDGETWGLVPHPRKSQFATVGEDNQVIVWDSESKKALNIAPLALEKGRFPKIRNASTTSNFPINQMARAIDYSPDGTLLAVGTNEGFCLIFDANTLKLIKSIDINKHGKRQITNQSQNWIEAIRFSPTGQTLAVATHGICIALLSVKNNFAVKKVLKEHTAAPTALDFSADGSFMRSISLSYEILYHSIDEGNLANSSHVTSATAMRDIVWATVTVKFDWSVMGIWQKGDGSEEVDYSNINTVDVSPSRSIIAVGNDEGTVHLFRYPAAKSSFSEKPTNAFRIHKGHSSHIPTVRFDYAEKYLYSVGGEDKCVFQWRITRAGI